MKRFVSLAVAGAMVLVACGSEDSASDTAASETEVASSVGTGVASDSATGADDPEPAATGTADVSSDADGEPVDGDPLTPVPTAVEAGAAQAPDAPAVDEPSDSATAQQFSPDEQAAADAWTTVFDSTVGFDAKALSLADASSLQPTVESYTVAGEGFGGISLVPTAVTVDGDTAEITYDVNFGENPAYSDQTGTITLIDGVWTVSRDEFCAFMSSARVSCP